MALMAVLQGCSTVPDAVNPVEWYKGARDWVSGDDEKKNPEPVAATAEIPGKDKPFPEVSSVPEAPPRSTEEEREKAIQSLKADREQARYTDQVIRRQTASKAPAPKPRAAPKPPPAATAKPAPPRIVARAPAPIKAEKVPPPTRSARPIPPPSAARRPPPPPMAPVRSVATPPAPPPPMAAPAPPPSKVVFGPPPFDIAIVQSQRAGSTPSSRGNAMSIDTLLPPRGAARSASTTPSPSETVAPAPDPASLDPASQVAVVTFTQGSSKLSGTARRIIGEVVEMQRQRGGTLHVIGHASSWTGDMNLVRHSMINFGLSLDRANTVARELLRRGIGARGLSIGAMSDTHPLFFEVMPSGEAGNRRVEIFLDGG